MLVLCAVPIASILEGISNLVRALMGPFDRI